jgi:hypothetical protein
MPKVKLPTLEELATFLSRQFNSMLKAWFDKCPANRADENNITT